MSTYPAPWCLFCSALKSSPEFIGDYARCTQYPDGIPKKIFFQSQFCKKTPDPQGQSLFCNYKFGDDRNDQFPDD